MSFTQTAVHPELGVQFDHKRGEVLTQAAAWLNLQRICRVEGGIPKSVLTVLFHVYDILEMAK